MSFTYAYPRPAVTADTIILNLHNNIWHILLIQRKNAPYKGCWALPGGFMEIDETIEQTAQRELEEETGLSKITLHQMHTYSALYRDPRGRTLTIVFWGICSDKSTLRAASDAETVQWFPYDNLPELAFDHDQIIRETTENIREILIRQTS